MRRGLFLLALFMKNSGLGTMSYLAIHTILLLCILSLSSVAIYHFPQIFISPSNSLLHRHNFRNRERTWATSIVSSRASHQSWHRRTNSSLWTWTRTSLPASPTSTPSTSSPSEQHKVKVVVLRERTAMRRTVWLVCQKRSACGWEHYDNYRGRSGLILIAEEEQQR